MGGQFPLFSRFAPRLFAKQCSMALIRRIHFYRAPLSSIHHSPRRRFCVSASASQELNNHSTSTRMEEDWAPQCPPNRFGYSSECLPSRFGYSSEYPPNRFGYSSGAHINTYYPPIQEPPRLLTQDQLFRITSNIYGYGWDCSPEPSLRLDPMDYNSPPPLKEVKVWMEEEDWPPLEECPQYRFGLITAAMRRFPWEQGDFDFDTYYPPIPDKFPWLRKLMDATADKYRPPYPEDTQYCPVCHPILVGTPDWSGRRKVDVGNHPVWRMDPIPCPFHIRDHFFPEGSRVSPLPLRITQEQLDRTKRYLHQLRTTRGYEVDCYPHGSLFCGRLQPMAYDSEWWQEFEKELETYLICIVIPVINSQTGKDYQLDKIYKVVWTPENQYLLTFGAKLEGGYSETFLATISLNPETPTHPPIEILEVLRKPSVPAPIPSPLPDDQVEPAYISEFVIN